MTAQHSYKRFNSRYKKQSACQLHSKKVYACSRCIITCRMPDDIRNTNQTELDFEVQVAAVIKYVPITDKKMNKIKLVLFHDIILKGECIVI